MSKKTARRKGPSTQPVQPAQQGQSGRPVGGSAAASSARMRRAEEAARATRNMWLARTGGTVVAAVIIAIALFFVLGGPSGFGGSATPAPVATVAPDTVVQGNGGTWTNITPDRLAQMMQNKDFTLLNVKTPYIGEIDGTDLYIPYTDLVARAAQLPADKSARIVVYCRTGNESAIASQTLLDLGYTNIWNLAGGMVAWQDSGRSIVQKNRT